MSPFVPVAAAPASRNWPSGWQPEYVQYGAGEYPFSHPETRAIGDFLLAHPNIAAFQSYHNAGGMILRGPGAKDRENVYPPADRKVYDALAEAGERLLPFYRYLTIHEDLYTVHGGEVNWAAEGLGIISFTNELWSRRQLAGALDEAPEFTRGREDANREPEGPFDRRYRRFAEERERLELVDRLLLGEVYTPWKPIDHPTYGPIEIGGFRRMYGRVPPAFMIEEMLHRNTAFTLYHADQMPPPNHLEPYPVDRKQALAAKEKLETPKAARTRYQAGKAAPAHYIPPQVEQV